MTYKEMKRKVLALIEELNENSQLLTDDPDISAKIDGVMNQVAGELARMKKIPRYIEIPAKTGSTICFADIEEASGCRVYQLGTVCGVRYVAKAGGTVLKITEGGTAEIDFYAYPEVITDENRESYVFELSDDALEIMPYGVAADLLKSDVSAEYGNVYANRYEQMIARLDPRYQMVSFCVEGGVEI